MKWTEQFLDIECDCRKGTCGRLQHHTISRMAFTSMEECPALVSSSTERSTKVVESFSFESVQHPNRALCLSLVNFVHILAEISTNSAADRTTNVFLHFNFDKSTCVSSTKHPGFLSFFPFFLHVKIQSTWRTTVSVRSTHCDCRRHRSDSGASRIGCGRGRFTIPMNHSVHHIVPSLSFGFSFPCVSFALFRCELRSVFPFFAQVSMHKLDVNEMWQMSAQRIRHARIRFSAVYLFFNRASSSSCRFSQHEKWSRSVWCGGATTMSMSLCAEWNCRTLALCYVHIVQQQPTQTELNEMKRTKQSPELDNSLSKKTHTERKRKR